MTQTGEGDGAPEHGSRTWVYERLTAEEDHDSAAGGMVATIERLCRVLTHELLLAGVTVNLRSTGGPEAVLAASDDQAKMTGELAFTIGEGPGYDAIADRRPVLISDLETESNRWPGYSAAALEVGIVAVFAFPLAVGASLLGDLELYATQSRWLSAKQIALAITCGGIATDMLLDGQENLNDGHHDGSLDSALDKHATIYQAQGMVMINLDVSLTEAMIRMRAQAYTANSTLSELAGEIVDGTTEIERDT